MNQMMAILELIELNEDKDGYQCSVCKKQFMTETACYRHIDNKHDIQIKVKMDSKEIPNVI